MARPDLPHPLSAYDDEQLRAALRLRLVALDSLASIEDLPHLRALAPGVVEVLTLDLPDTIVTPPMAYLAHLGTSEELIAAGREHLSDLIAAGLQRREVVAEDGLRFSFLHGDDYSQSSVALLLPTALRAAEPDADLTRGVAVAVPDRHHVAYRLLQGLESLMALGPMAAFARNGFDSGDGPISPDVYWARGPRLDQWTAQTEQRPAGIAIGIPPDLTALVEDD